MAIARLLRELSIGETRWVALDDGGRPVALYLERESDATRRAVIGEQLQARARKTEIGLRGVFMDLGAKGEAFMRLGTPYRFSEGSAQRVEVAAEARRGKLARVTMKASDPPMSGVARWRTMLVDGASAPVEDRPAGDADVEAVFEEALSATVPLTGGGAMHLARTEALIAADIDTGNRPVRAGRQEAALAVNLAAAQELARQVHLRSWGGLMVLDCVARMEGAAGSDVRKALFRAWQEISTRQMKALTPSVFGLMEISADWQTTPLEDRLADGDETPALAGLRQLDVAARQERMKRLTLTLPRPAFDWLARSGLGAQERLAAKYGARLTIATGAGDVPEVSETR